MRLWRAPSLKAYMSASPGGFEQLSFYDAIRGELYRDLPIPLVWQVGTLVRVVVFTDALTRYTDYQPRPSCFMELCKPAGLLCLF